FFSSRRRHTRWPRDWSSDVCSSDLNGCVVDPMVLVEELQAIERRGIRPELYLSDRAHLILPYHRLIDAAEEAAKAGAKVGTTGQIGRASCRERVEIAGGAVRVKRKE